MKKVFVVLMAAAFMTGSAGLAVAEEKKADDKGKVETPAPAKKMAMKAKSADGTVKTAGADSLVVMGKEGKGKNAKEAEWTFAVDDKTIVKKGGKAITAADIQPGDSVHVRYMEHEGKAVAQTVTVKAGGSAKKMGGATNPCAAKK